VKQRFKPRVLRFLSCLKQGNEMEGYGCLASSAAAMHQGERAVSTLGAEHSSRAKAYTTVHTLMSLIRAEAQ